MIKDEQIEEISKKLIKIIIDIEKRESKDLNRRADNIIVDSIFREFMSLVKQYED